MITTGEGDQTVAESQTRPSRLPEHPKPLTGARRRLGRLIDLDERVLIDLQLEVEARERGLH